MRSVGVSSSLQDSEYWGGLEEKEFHIVFFRGSFLAERGPRGISTCYSAYSSFWRSSDDEIASNGCFWISNVDYDRYAIPRDVHEETARSAESLAGLG